MDMKLTQANETVAPLDTWPPEVAPILAKIEEELQAGRTKQALELLRRTDVTSAWLDNAMGVCQLRQGQAKEAVDTFRRLAVGDHLNLRANAPVVFKTNFATAMLLSGNLGGCFSLLKEINQEAHPAVIRLRAAQARWKEGLTFWERINWYLGGEPDRPVMLDSPGDLR